MLRRSPPAPCVNAVLLRLCVFIKPLWLELVAIPFTSGILLGTPTKVDAGVYRVHDVRVFDMALTKLQVKSAIEDLAQCKGNLARLDWTGPLPSDYRRTRQAARSRSGQVPSYYFGGFSGCMSSSLCVSLHAGGRAVIVCCTNSFS